MFNINIDLRENPIAARRRTRSDLKDITGVVKYFNKMLRCLQALFQTVSRTNVDSLGSALKNTQNIGPFSNKRHNLKDLEITLPSVDSAFKTARNV